MNFRTKRILMLSLGFMLLFVSFNTLSNMMITILASVKQDYSWYSADAKLALFILYIVFAVSNFFVPIVINFITVNGALVLGALIYTCYMASFNFVEPSWLLYVASAIVGIGAAIIWAAQGTYLTLNSDDSTIARNSGIFWALFQCSLLIGNIFVFYAFNNKQHIDQTTRYIVYNVLVVLAVLGVITLLLLMEIKAPAGAPMIQAPIQDIRKIIKDSLKMYQDKQMLLLCFSFWATGALLTFAGSIYSNAVGSTRTLAGKERYTKRFVGLSGVLFGVGEVVGGTIFGIFGSKTSIFGRNPIIVLGTVSLSVCFLLIFLNLPDDSVFHDTYEMSFFHPPEVYIALLCSFLLGFGDSCFETQIYSIIGTIFRDNSPPAFAAFKFVQSISCSLSFFYIRYMGLRSQLVALFIQIITAAIAFIIVEVKVRCDRRYAVDSVTVSSSSGSPALSSSRRKSSSPSKSSSPRKT